MKRWLTLLLSTVGLIIGLMILFIDDQSLVGNKYLIGLSIVTIFVLVTLLQILSKSTVELESSSKKAILYVSALILFVVVVFQIGQVIIDVNLINSIGALGFICLLVSLLLMIKNEPKNEPKNVKSIL